MNENELYFVREYKIDNPLITQLHSIIDSCCSDCHKKNFHEFIYETIYDIELITITKSEIINLTIMGKNMKFYDLDKKLKVSR